MSNHNGTRRLRLRCPLRDRMGRDALVAILHNPAERGGEFSCAVQDECMNLDAKGPSRDSGLFIVPSAQLGHFRERDVFLKERDLGILVMATPFTFLRIEGKSSILRPSIGSPQSMRTTCSSSEAASCPTE
jgi:hypothetical protein